MRICLVRGIAVVAVMLALIAPANAQETTATIVGHVTDDTGAVLPGVSIVLKHVATGRTYESVSSGTGAYAATLLPPGVYDVTFSLAGFQTLVIKSVQLSVNDRLDVNGKLRVGGVTEVVEVTASRTSVQPTPAVQNLVDSKQVQELPINNRAFVQLATLAPGVSSDLPDEVALDQTQIISISVNGGRRNAVNWLVDGVSNVDVGSNITLLVMPTLESISEFKIISSSYAAEWPRSGGGIVNVVTKSGSKKYSGTAYDFVRSDKLNANSWIRNQSTDPTVAGHPPKLDYKNFGYTFGGPVPKMSDKLFFFWSQEWRKITRAPSSLTATVPDPTWLTDTTSTNYVDPSLRDANAVKLMAAWPAPNVPGKNQYLVSAPSIQDTRQEVIRMDYDVSSRWRVTGRYTHDLSKSRQIGGLFNGIAVPNVATTDTSVPGQVLSLGLKTLFGGHALNEFTYQKSGNVISTVNPEGTKGMRGDYGINIPELFPGNPSNRIPGIAVSGLSSFNSIQLYHIQYINHSVTDNFSLQRGNHQFKAGFLMTFEQKNENAASNTQGSFSFGASTNPTRTAFQNFLLGNADRLCTTCSYSEADTDIVNHLRWSRYEMYVQDTWRARKNLTIDYGIRYSLYPPLTDTNNMLVTFDPKLYSAANAPLYLNATGTQVDYTTGDRLVGMLIAGKNSPYGRGIYAFQKNSFQPRIGFALDPKSSGNTIVRGAFGVYFDQPLVGIFEQNTFTDPPFVNTVSLTGITLSNPGAGTTTTQTGVRTLIASATDFKNPRTMQWNIGMTRRLWSKATVEISYVGARGDNLIRPTNINFPQPADVVALQTTVPAAVNPVRPFRSYGTITMRETTAKSRYWGVLTAFRWQLARNGTVSVNYTWSRNQTDATNDRDAIDIPQNPANLAAEYADARTDRRHILSASYVYELPFFRESPNAILKTALGGWQIAGITYANSGQPVPRISVDTNGSRRGGFADLVGNPMAGMLDTTGTPPYWFNPAAFAPPADGTFGNSGRSPFRQPGFYKWDITLSKNFYPTKSIRIQFRADFINAFNQVNWLSDPSANGLDNTCTTSITTCTISTDRFGQLIAVRAPREIQLGLKLYW